MTTLTQKGRAVSEGKQREPLDGRQEDMFDQEFLDLANQHQLFPSHPWNVRAALETLGPRLFPTWPGIPRETVVYDPCAGLGHMTVPLREYFHDVRPSDLVDWGKGYAVADAMEFEASTPAEHSIAIMNPPFDGELGDMAEKFVRQAQKTCDHVIILARLAFICGATTRYSLHHENPVGNLTTFMPCTERCPMRLGFYDPKANKPQEHAWFHYQRGYTGHYTGINLAPGSRDRLFRPEDRLI